MKPLNKNNIINRKGPVVLVIMDGMGIGKENEGNAFFLARTPNLDRLMKNCPYTTLKAHGTAVGLPSDADMGNSEVGHNALGAGRIFDQGAKLVSNAIESGEVFTTSVWKELIEKPVKSGNTMHFIGLLSDGNVHSHINHLFSIIEKAASEGVKKLMVHILLDGRDVPETSANLYIDQLEGFLKKITEQGMNYRIASGGGRMVTTMDRYEADWSIVKRGWDAHVLGKARPFRSAMEALEAFRKEEPGIIDQYLPAFTVVDDKGPVGTIEDGDSVILFNFRGDRAIELTKAFEMKEFKFFDRERIPSVVFAGMMQYDGDLKIPAKFLVNPPRIDNTVSEYLVASGVRQYAISETQKFGHVTYFWNGNRTEKFDEASETYFEVPSDRVEFNERPWMKGAEITDKVIETIEAGGYDFIRLNYPNGDMVGHTGDLEAAIIAAETVDICLKRLLEAVEKSGGIAFITADHGNLDEMFELDAKTGAFQKDKSTGRLKSKTAHTLNPVPVIIYDPEFKGEYEIDPGVKNPGLGNVAATLLNLMGFDAPESYLPSILKLKR
ncbi:MAG TPA: 2,3-bisphosphoglycerate-independent phosphoglycerate mutase [Spirochaetota bacterium]|nr:2,3-bisphosphoglycerate-independent phosphoglycerate mutase [Spirochaetota bacterium]HPF05919.1 2,3-bisphosphoglycerate-independent phosphoglycerate mutase [Spirochaetota bacterium]HPJ42413.1 2,3-bisphosphoglycerate-independent phosphoglycerate mutase [Spirochaetota bacterium]HRX46799.1 2,3-bisphosphoglycerate-independent phosphoglycerate mutase [Spirochaetota bacterium]